MNIHHLGGISHDQLFEVLGEAFKDYTRTWTRQEFEELLQRRGYDPALSFGAFGAGKLVSFTFNCTGDFDGHPTAYDAGSGTVPSHRGKGLATAVFETSIPVLQAAGIQQYLLEVLETNTSAISIYNAAGFTERRRFHYFIQNKEGVKNPLKELPATVTISETNLAAIRTLTFSDDAPAWQNSFPCLERSTAPLRIFTALKEGIPVGFAIIDPVSGDIPQLAVNKAYRRQGIGTALFTCLQQCNLAPQLRMINMDTRNAAGASFLCSFGIHPSGQQIEMSRPL